MTCTPVKLPSGVRAIVCGPRTNRKCRCGRRADLLCDWKVKDNKSGTCDEPVCSACTTKPAPDKDLCRTHAAAFRQWKERQDG